MRLASLAAALCVLLLAGRAGAAEVKIENFTFAPAEITIMAGQTVTWRNDDDIPHVVVDAAAAKAFRSPVLDTDGAFSHAFTVPGTYRYYCALHPHMQGVVVVK